MTILVIKPGAPIRSGPSNWPHLFLAGTIDQGNSVDWQSTVPEFYKTKDIEDVVLVNPRRDNWNPSVEQSITDPEFHAQVSFELGHIEQVDAVAMWLVPGSLSPISLAEFGLLCGMKSAGHINRLIVGCPAGFWRKGNVEMMTDRYGIPLVDTIDELLEESYALMMRNHQRRIEFYKSKV
jgi:hypothetical protein